MLPAPEIGIRAADAISQEPSTMTSILCARGAGGGEGSSRWPNERRLEKC